MLQITHFLQAFFNKNAVDDLADQRMIQAIYFKVSFYIDYLSLTTEMFLLSKPLY